MQTIGQKLKAAREEKNITLEKAFEATRIRTVYLQALETDDLTSMPSPVQARGYLRNYAEYLGLNIDQLLEEVLASQQNLGEIIGPADLFDQQPDQTFESSSTQEAAPLSPPIPDPEQQTEPRPKPQSDIIEEQVQQFEPVFEETIETEQEDVLQPDVSENLWQTWLNRVSSVISTRVNRKPELRDDSLINDVESQQSESPHQEVTQPEPSQPENLQPSDEIFREIGIELRSRRETLSLHLEEVERNTHVKAHYLDALEQGAMDRLPSTVQTRGMLSNYASFLDMDVDAILLRFADALQTRHRERNPQLPVRKPGQPILSNMPALRNFIAGDMIFGIGMAVLLVGFVIWGINRVMAVRSLQDIQPTAPSISDVLLSSPDPSLFTPTATLLPVEAFPGEATATIIIPTVNINVSVQVNLIAVERTYVRVVVDDVVAFEGRVIPGNAYLFEAEEQIEVLVGSGAAIRVAYNGRDLGLMGAFGQIVSNIYRAQEVINPTASATPLATNTVPATPTSSPTQTPVPSLTP